MKLIVPSIQDLDISRVWIFLFLQNIMFYCTIFLLLPLVVDVPERIVCQLSCKSDLFHGSNSHFLWVTRESIILCIIPLCTLKPTFTIVGRLHLFNRICVVMAMFSALTVAQPPVGDYRILKMQQVHLQKFILFQYN